MLVAVEPRNRIMYWLGERKMTIQEMARLADMSYSTAYNIATSEQIPQGVRWGSLKKIAKALNVDVGELEKDVEA